MKKKPARKSTRPAPAGNEPERTITCSRKVRLDARLSVRPPGRAPIRFELRTSSGSRLLSWAEASPPASATYSNLTLGADGCDTVAFRALGDAAAVYASETKFSMDTTPAGNTRTVITDTAPSLFSVTVENPPAGAPVVIRLDGLLGIPVRSITVPPASKITIQGTAIRAQIIPAAGARHRYLWSVTIGTL